MIIPNAANAVVDLRKLKDYCLNPHHKLGKYKARVFVSILGVTAENAAELSEVLLVAVKTKDAKIGNVDKFGQRFTVDFEWKRGDKRATIRSGWIIKSGSNFPSLTTCFVL